MTTFAALIDALPTALAPTSGAARDNAAARLGEIVRQLPLAIAGCTPVSLIAGSAFGLDLRVLALVILAPIVAGLLARMLTDAATRRLVAHAVTAGVAATLLYDLCRGGFLWSGLMGGDPIPHIGTALGIDPAWVAGYAWRYLGNGTGLALTFLALGLRGTRVGILYGLAVCSCLLLTLAVSPLGTTILFPLNLTTVIMATLGHAIYGGVLGTIAARLHERDARRAAQPAGIPAQPHAGRRAVGTLLPSARRPLPGSAVALGLLIVCLGPAAALAAADTPDIDSWGYTGEPQTWTVPAHVTSATIRVSGAQGGDGTLQPGGLGGEALATVPVIPGEVLQVDVGGAGRQGPLRDPRRHLRGRRRLQRRRQRRHRRRRQLRRLGRRRGIRRASHERPQQPARHRRRRWRRRRRRTARPRRKRRDRRVARRQRRRHARRRLRCHRGQRRRTDPGRLRRSQLREAARAHRRHRDRGQLRARRHGRVRLLLRRLGRWWRRRRMVRRRRGRRRHRRRLRRWSQTWVQPDLPTTTVIRSSGSPSVYGDPVRFTAVVSPADSRDYPATGTVQFEVDGAPLGGPATLSRGHADSVAALRLASGPHGPRRLSPHRSLHGQHEHVHAGCRRGAVRDDRDIVVAAHELRRARPFHRDGRAAKRDRQRAVRSRRVGPRRSRDARQRLGDLTGDLRASRPAGSLRHRGLQGRRHRVGEHRDADAVGQPFGDDDGDRIDGAAVGRRRGGRLHRVGRGRRARRRHAHRPRALHLVDGSDLGGRSTSSTAARRRLGPRR